MEEEIKQTEEVVEEVTTNDEGANISLPKASDITSVPVNNLEKVTSLIAKYPSAFVAALFCILFYITHTYLTRRYEEEIVQWRELYIKEKEENDKLQHELLISAGVIKSIERQNKEMETAKQEAKNKAEQILELTNKN